MRLPLLLLACTALLHSSHGFYLPGVAPIEYADGDPVSPNRSTSRSQPSSPAAILDVLNVIYVFPKVLWRCTCRCRAPHLAWPSKYSALLFLALYPALVVYSLQFVFLFHFLPFSRAFYLAKFYVRRFGAIAVPTVGPRNSLPGTLSPSICVFNRIFIPFLTRA